MSFVNPPSTSPSDVPTSVPLVSSMPSVGAQPSPSLQPSSVPSISFMPSVSAQPTVSLQPSATPSSVPSISSMPSNIIIDISFHLTLDQVQEYYMNITYSDRKKLENITFKFLSDNIGDIGGYTLFTPLSLEIEEIAVGYTLFTPLSLTNDDFAKYVQLPLVTTLAFQIKASFSVTPAFLQWLEIFGTVGSRGLTSSLQRSLADTTCTSKDFAECCSSKSINAETRSKKCKSLGCNVDICAGKQKKNRKERFLIESKHEAGDPYSHARDLQTEIGDLTGKYFLDVLNTYTIFKAEDVSLVLNATNTQAVASCSASRYADEHLLSSFTCDVYEGNNCQENEDILFEPGNEVCTCAMPSTSPFCGSAPTPAPYVDKVPLLSRETTCKYSSCATRFDYLDRFNVECPDGYALNSWKYTTTNCGACYGKIQYQCVFIGIATKYTEQLACQEANHRPMEYLDRHNIKCSASATGAVLNSFRLIHGSCASPDMAFQVTCYDLSEIDQGNCFNRVTSDGEDLWEQPVGILEQYPISCNTNEVLTSWRHSRTQLGYTCCLFSL